MLNTKYIIQQGPGGDTVLANPAVLGAAWFVRGVRYESDARSVMNALTGFDPKDTAIVLEKDRNAVSIDPQPDSAASIQLIRNDNDVIVYRSESKTRQFAVFSEVFYDRGWKAYVEDATANGANSTNGSGTDRKSVV